MSDDYPTLVNAYASMSDMLRHYLELYGRDHLGVGPAHLLIPEWAQRALDDLTPETRRRILDDIDRIAAAHGLTTPTVIEVVRPTGPPEPDGPAPTD